MKNKILIIILSIVIQLITIGIVFGKDSNSEANLNESNSSIGLKDFLNPKDPPNEINQRIIGGQTALIEDYPWQVLVYNVLDPFFNPEGGGIIINDTLVLTAAHVVFDEINSNPPAPLYIRAGVTEYSDTTGQDILVAEVIIHEYYSVLIENGQSILYNDIALLILNSGLSFNNKVKPISLIKSNHEAYGLTDPGVLGIITGWGKTESGDVSESLQFAEIPIVSNVDAITIGNYESHHITDGMICAGSFESGRTATCHGDSGGPLIIDTGPGGMKLAGITSFALGDSCDDPLFPSVFTRISYYESWIEQYIPVLESPINLDVSGPDLICSHSLYSLSIPDWFQADSIRWFWDPPEALYIDSKQPKDPGDIILTPSSIYQGYVNLSATLWHSDWSLNPNWDDSLTFSKNQILIGTPIPNSYGPFVWQGGHEYQVSCLCPFQEATFRVNPIDGIENYSWFLFGGEFPVYLGNQETSLPFFLENENENYYLELKQYHPECGWSSSEIINLCVQNCLLDYSNFSFIIYPNPFQSNLFVALNPTSNPMSSKSYLKGQTFWIYLYNWDNLRVFSQSFTINEIPFEMDLSFLERGKYLVHIVAGSQIIHSEQLIKN